MLAYQKKQTGGSLKKGASLAICVFACILIIGALSSWKLLQVEAPKDAPWLYQEIWLGTRDRLLSALFIGAALGTAGVLLRTATSNPLADPHITGVNAGAAFGAVASSFITGSSTGVYVLPGALAGAAVASSITLVLSLRGRNPDLSGTNAIQKMVLLGIAVSAVFSAMTSIFLVLDEAQLTTVLAWLNGRLGGIRLPDLIPVIIAVAVLLPILFAAGRALDALSTGDSVSRAIGANPALVRKWVVVSAVILTATCVAAAGPIGFLGLLAAVIAQRVCGRTHRFVLISAACVGATGLLVADTIGQQLWAPAETPVGILTGIAGVPLLLWGIRRMGSTGKSR